jgi:hypothetical protein
MEIEVPFGFSADMFKQFGNGKVVQQAGVDWAFDFPPLDSNKLYSFSILGLGDSREGVMPSNTPVEYDLDRLEKDLSWIWGALR